MLGDLVDLDLRLDADLGQLGGDDLAAAPGIAGRRQLEGQLNAVGVPCRQVVLVRPSTLPKTSSGKLQRALCRQQYLDGKLETVA